MAKLRGVLARKCRKLAKNVNMLAKKKKIMRRMHCPLILSSPNPNIHLQQQQQLDYQCAFKTAACRAEASREAGPAGLECRPLKTRRTRIIYC